MKRIHILYSLGIALSLNMQIYAQVNHGGRPRMNSQDFNPDRVLYLLPPLHPLEVDAQAKRSGQESFHKTVSFAIQRTVDINPGNNGQWVRKEGTHIWRAHLISPEAKSVGIGFNRFSLTSGARLFLYTPDGNHIKGAFNAQNNKESKRFVAGHLPGEEVIIELQVENPSREFGSMEIAFLSHGLKDDVGPGTAQACEIDINCPEGDEWQILKNSVCYIETPTQLCTGVLVNNTAYNGTPYILTAEHCVSSNVIAGYTTFYFGYENTDCFGDDASADFSIGGAQLIATADSIDFTLLKLSSSPPREYNVYYAGWDARDQNHYSTATIHHPNADAKKISRDFDATHTATWVPGDLNDYIISSNLWIKQWDIGTTEGGSSGSPLFNSNKRVIGLLSGGLAYCGDSIGYDNEAQRVIYDLTDNTNDFYSKLHYAFNYYDHPEKQLKKWLDPAHTGQASIGGLNPNTLSIQPVTYNAGFSIYPNPVKNHLYLSMKEMSEEPSIIRIRDITGKTKMEKSLSSGKPVEIDVSGLERGVYFISVTGARFYGTLKFIRQ